MFKAIMLSLSVLFFSNTSYSATCNVQTDVSSQGTINDSWAQASPQNCAAAAAYIAYIDCMVSNSCSISYGWGMDGWWAAGYHTVQCRDPYSCMYY